MVHQVSRKILRPRYLAAVVRVYRSVVTGMKAGAQALVVGVMTEPQAKGDAKAALAGGSELRGSGPPHFRKPACGCHPRTKTHPAGGTPDHNAEVDLHYPALAAGGDRPVQLETRGVTSHRHTKTPAKPQKLIPGELWRGQEIHKASVVSKLVEAGRPDLAEPLAVCHTEVTISVCCGCNRAHPFYNRCDLFYCPQCQPRLARQRQESIAWWTVEVAQPKHVVLTVRNIPILTKGHVQEFKKWLGRLRRSKFARGWRGGFYALEVTNESRGWHLHAHLLVDAHWIDAAGLARQWTETTGGHGKIVKVKDARGTDYLKELTKYVVKGSQLAAWPAPEVVQFVTAFKGVRTFGVFGSLYGKRTEFREWLDEMTVDAAACECGSTTFRYFSEPEYEWFLATEAGRSPPRTDFPAPPPQFTFPCLR